tara:strand:- start:1928 stop:2404 length:477 start_codon:yes stop_codon:yes gene_type:complete
MVFGMVHSQENKVSDCALQTENEKWKLEFSKTDSKSEQIELIKRKLVWDSIYKETKPVINTAHGRINGHEDENGNYCGCKILFLLVPQGKGEFYELNLNSRPHLLEVIKSLNKENIKRIFYMLENDNNALGPTGRCGIIKLTTTDEELIKRIKNVLQQ